MPMCVHGVTTYIYAMARAFEHSYVCVCLIAIYVCLNLFAQHPTVTGDCDTAMSHPYPFVSSDFRLWSHFHSILFYAIS